MSAPDRIFAWDDFEGNAPRAGDWCDEKSECPDGAVEYIRLDPNTRVVTPAILREAIGRIITTARGTRR